MLTALGFKRMRTADYLLILQDQARQLFGDDVDLSDRSPLGKFLYLQAQQRAEDNELAETVWNSRFVDTSEGVSLDANVKPLITRKRWLKASGLVSLNLDRGVNVPASYLFRTKYGVYFKTLYEVQAFDDGDYVTEVEALEYGSGGNVAAGDISEIVNNLAGLNSVTNPEDFFNGQDEESDEELKTRYYSSRGKLGARRIESIQANVLDEVDGVRACKVIDNETDTVDEEGRPPHSFETIVLGGLDEPIAKKIIELKPAGIRAYGSNVVEVTDERGIVHAIGFTRAATVPVYVKVFAKKSAQFALDGDDQLKRRIIEYVGGPYNDESFDGVGMSENVILSRLESRLFAVDGVVDAYVTLSTDGVNYATQNITVGFAEVAETDIGKIEVLPLE